MYRLHSCFFFFLTCVVKIKMQSIKKKNNDNVKQRVKLLNADLFEQRAVFRNFPFSEGKITYS